MGRTNVALGVPDYRITLVSKELYHEIQKNAPSPWDVHPPSLLVCLFPITSYLSLDGHLRCIERGLTKIFFSHECSPRELVGGAWMAFVWGSMLVVVRGIAVFLELRYRLMLK